jgi:2-(1,2-epoxy-1,2-dihydrophenyl)acetyl-CoA isomerase
LIIQQPEDRSYLVDIDDGVLTLSWNRPDHGNAIKTDMVPGLIALFQTAKADPKVRVILIRGEGKTFSAGGDVAGFASTLESEVAVRQDEFRRRISRLRLLSEAVVGYDGPIVVAVRGAVAGVGLLYPLAADYVIGDPTSLFAFVHQGVGLSPDGGVSALLPQVVGHRTARGLLVTGARVKAEEALRLGLLNRLVEAEELEDSVAQLAKRLARAPQLAVKLAKRLVNEAPHRSFGDQLDVETEGVVTCVADEDFREGVQAFLEKRTPDFPSTR